MTTITQTANAGTVWNGTVPGDSDPAVTHFKLYCAQSVDTLSSYRLVKKFANTGNPITIGPLTYAQLFLISPSRTFYLRVTAVRSGKDDDLISAANPALSVTPSTIKGWTLEQLTEQGMRPSILVGYDSVNGLFYPVLVVADGTSGYKLKT